MWNEEIAKAIKENAHSARRKAVGEASGSIGVIEQVSPLIISAMAGGAMYEDDLIIKSETFARYTEPRLAKGKEVIIVPIDSATTIAVIDLVG